ncbi:MAG TPA: asparagine--tRNA ligase [Bacilli bacterium]|nr:asparagine--tRNA ligase [Bacilli bacterium]
MNTVREIYEAFAEEELFEGQNVNLAGWVKTNRDNGSIGFIEFNDGTKYTNLQLVYDKINIENFDKVTHYNTGTALIIEGYVVLTPDNKQPFEVHLETIELVGSADESYPLQKKRHGFEFLREISHLRPRTNTFSAVYRVRSELSFAVHKFFHDNNFIYVHTPIITGNDAEGAGSVFKVITDDKNPDDFFGTPASLTVSGQLHVEAFAMAFRDVYTFGPTFRAEKSYTARHAAEFWMIEPELAFADLNDDMECIEECVKYCVNHILENCSDEIQFFNKFIDKGLNDRLVTLLAKDFAKISYTEAIEILKKALKDGVTFENSKIEWGMDLQTEHERYLAEKHVNGPVFITDYPKEIKAFYMRLNDDGKTVAACDLLVPGVGELVGGSQREERLDILEAKMKEMGNAEELDWYLDLRRYGGCKHSGFGIGFDRLIMYVTGMQNIRDVQPYARTTGSLKY